MATYDDDQLPGLSTRYLPLILLWPALIAVAKGLSFLFPSLDEGLLFAGPFVGTAVVFAIVAVRDSNRKRRAAGLVPKDSGFSAQVDLVAAKLRERAGELEQAIRFNREVKIPFALEEYLKEVRNTASTMDRRELVTGLTLSIPQEASLGHGPLDRPSLSAIESHLTKLHGAAAELEKYAGEVRARGGVYRATENQLAGCGAVIAAIAIAGGWLAWHGWPARSGGFWWGLALVVTAVLLGWVIQAMQREPA